MSNTKQLIADNIKNIRESLGYTQTDFAKKLNYSDKAISKWERAESLPDILVLKEITDLAGLPLDYLVTDHKKEEKSIVKKSKARVHIIIAMLSCGLVWLLCTIAYIILANTLMIYRSAWVVFVLGGVITEIILLVLNSIWGRAKFNYIIISALVWNILALAYLLLFKNYPIIFVIGAPGQILIILWSLFKPFKIKNNG